MHRQLQQPFDSLFSSPVFLDPDDSSSATLTEEELSELFSAAGSGEEGDAESGDSSPAQPDGSSAATAQPSHAAQPPGDSSGSPEHSDDSSSSTLLDRLREAGFQDIEDEEQATERLYDAFIDRDRQLSELREQVEQLRPLAALASEMIRGQSAVPRSETSGQIESKQEPKSPDVPWGEIPSLDMQLVYRYRERDPETGAWKWSQDTPADIRQKAEQYELAAEQWSNRLIYNPQEVFQKGTTWALVQAIENRDPSVIEALDKYIEQKVGRKLEQQTEEQFIEQIERENPWIYRTDPVTGKPVIDPYSGNPVPSDEGALVFHHIDRLRSQGVRDPRLLWEYAVAAVGRSQNQSSGDSSSQTESREQRNADFLRRHAETTPDRSGSLDTPEKSQNKNLRPGQKLLQEAQVSGVDFWQ